MQSMQSLLRSGVVQSKLMVNQPGDSYEQEADRAADQVMRMSDSTAADAIQQTPAGARVQRKCEHCEEELQRNILPEPSQENPDPENIPVEDVPVYDDPETDEDEPEGEDGEGGGETVESTESGQSREVQLKALTSQSSQPSQTFAGHLSAGKGGGQPLDAGVRSFMEARFGADFGAVRVHADARAAAMTREVQAAAFTHGHDLYFGAARYEPNSNSGRRLLAHELTHVLQQTGPRVPQAGSTVQRYAMSMPAGSSPTIQRKMEVDVNLGSPNRVRVISDNGSTQVFNPVSGGKKTLKLIGRTFTLSKRSSPTAQIGKWGLQYFCPFNGGIGFHSNIAYPTMKTICKDKSKLCNPSAPQGSRVKVKLQVDGSIRSHGCIRMRETDVKAFYSLVRSGIPVRVYRQSNWLPPS